MYEKRELESPSSLRVLPFDSMVEGVENESFESLGKMPDPDVFFERFVDCRLGVGCRSGDLLIRFPKSGGFLEPIVL